MTDITVLMMADDNPVPDGPGRWRAGEIVDVFPLKQVPGPATHPRHLHIHITGIPFSFERIKSRMKQQHFAADGETRVARRKFVGRGDLMLTDMREALNRDREITVAWADAKFFSKRRVPDALDPTEDVTDADFE